MTRTSSNQGDLFGYISPVDGSPCLHPPLCACGSCPAPVETFSTAPLKLYRNIYFTGVRDYECTNMAYCVAPAPPTSQWKETADKIPASMTQLERRGVAAFYGWL